jgi:nucleotide-binding universal stress UspA family protein
MKAVVGVDSEGIYRKGLEYLCRLGFCTPSAEFVHVELPQLLFPPEAFACVPEIEDARLQVAKDTLDEALQSARQSGLGCEASHVVGPPAATLMHRAEAIGADLIVIGTTDKSKYGRLFLGNIGRGLAIAARQSVLVAKDNVRHAGKLRAIFTTNHSAYCEKGLDLLIRFAPSGLEKLTLLTATGGVRGAKQAAEIDAASCGDAAVAKLSAAGIPAEFKIVDSSLCDAIQSSMEDTKADLLIMAAHGHGFIERCLFGSVSLQQVVSTSHSVLLLRPDGA